MMSFSLLAALAPLVTAQTTMTYTSYASTDQSCSGGGLAVTVDISGTCKVTTPGNFFGAVPAPPTAPPGVDYYGCGSNAQTGGEGGCASFSSTSPLCYAVAHDGGCYLAQFDTNLDGTADIVFDYRAVITLPPAPPAEDPCFPGSALLSTRDGRTVRVDGLKDGDDIVAVDSNGALKSDKVSMLLSVAQPEAESTFIALTTKGGVALNLTAEHHLPVGASCCATLKKAAEVTIGDKVWVVSGASVVAQEVTKLTKVVAKGLYSPVLAHGSFPVVNGVVTSFDSIGKVTLASYGLAPLLQACNATNTCGLLRYALLGK